MTKEILLKHIVEYIASGFSLTVEGEDNILNKDEFSINIKVSVDKNNIINENISLKDIKDRVQIKIIN